MAYEKVGWKDYPDKTTPTSAANLNKMDEGIANNDKNIGDVSKISDIGDGTTAGAIAKLKECIAELEEENSELNSKIDTSGDVLWENPDTSALFSAQSIDLSKQNWKVAVISFTQWMGIPPVVIYKGMSPLLYRHCTPVSNGSIWYYEIWDRQISLNDSELTFSDGGYIPNGSSSGGVSNSIMIPERIVKIM